MNNIDTTIYIFGFILTLGVVASGCDELSIGNEFLSQPPTIDYTVDSVFASQQGVEELLWNTYATLPYGLSSYDDPDLVARSEVIWRDGTAVAITDLASDARRSAASRFWYTGNIDATAHRNQLKFAFTNGVHWKAFFQGWTIVENIDQVPDMPQELKDQYKAEAKMIMAIHYVEMFRYIGGIAWVNRAYRANDDLNIPRLTVEASVDSITTLIDEAMLDLPVEPTNVEEWDGRMTRAGAAGLKARLLLFAASPLFNSDEPYMQGEAAEKRMVWTGGKTMELWERARDAAQDAIDLVESSGYYGIVQPSSRDSAAFRNAYKSGYFDRGSGETLISTRAYYNASGSTFDLLWARYADVNWGTYSCPTQTYVDMFPDKNGIPIDQSPLYDEDNPYQNRDPRFYETLTSNVSTWEGRPAEMWIGGRERLTEDYGAAFAGYYIRKYVLDKQEGLNSPLHWSYLRIPELYLSYAEALNEINGGPTPEAFSAVNKVRNRVGLNDVQTIMDNPSSQEEFRKLLIRERALEHGFENIRWFDMVRWKREDIFAKELEGMKVYKKGDETADGSICSKPFCYDRFSIMEEEDWAVRYWRTNFSPKFYLDPIPSEEINKDYGMVQNPGWEVTGN